MDVRLSRTHVTKIYRYICSCICGFYRWYWQQQFLYLLFVHISINVPLVVLFCFVNHFLFILGIESFGLSFVILIWLQWYEYFSGNGQNGVKCCILNPFFTILWIR